MPIKQSISTLAQNPALCLVLVTLVSGCLLRSPEEIAARSAIMQQENISSTSAADQLIKNVFVTDGVGGKIVCGRYSDDKFVYTPKKHLILKDNGPEFLSLFWTMCTHGNPTMAKIVESKTKEIAKRERERNWQISSKKSDIDDSQKVTMGVWSKAEIEGDLSIDRVKPVLLIRCMESQTSVILDWKRYLGIDTTIMTSRIDKEKAVKKLWDISTANNTVFSQTPIPFIKSLFEKESLLARITPYGSNPVTVTFDVSGLQDQIKPLREACNW